MNSMTAEFCRETDIRASTPLARLTGCAPVRRLPVVPGQSETTDALPIALQRGPEVLLTYRIRIFNSIGRSAGDSATSAYAAAGQAPAAVDSLRATATEQGVILEWHSAAAHVTGTADLVDLKRLDLSKPSTSAEKAKPTAAHLPKTGNSAPAKNSGERGTDGVHLRAADRAAASKDETARTIDTSAVIGETYIYTAQRVRAVMIGKRQLEIRSEPSDAVMVAMRDTFPPKTPAGLVTISGSAGPSSATVEASLYIDLSWEPNGEPDLAGYRVYRQLARPDGSPQGPVARLTPLTIVVPAYRDVAVRAGQGYIYSVTAVDAAGNESAPSAKALETIAPKIEESIH